MKLSFQILVPGLPFQGDSLRSQSLGGSETAGLCLAKSLAKLGHKVMLFCNTTKPGMYDGVAYFPAHMWAEWAAKNPHDVSIVQRIPQSFKMPLASKLNYLWCHDLAQRRFAAQFHEPLWNIDRVVTLSSFMTEQYKKIFGCSDKIIFQTTNGIDHDLINEAGNPQVIPKRLLYAARPERGLDVLLKDIMPKILAKHPDARLSICTYANPVQLPPEFTNEIERLKASLPVDNLGNLDKVQLYRAMKSHALYVYPTPSSMSPEFVEVSCIAAMEAQACGLPIVATANGALPETAPMGGVIKLGEGYAERFVEQCDALLSNENLWQAHSIGGKNHIRNYDWDLVAQQWVDQIVADLNERSSNKNSLAHWFYRRSDIEAIKKIKFVPDQDEMLASLTKEIEQKYAFTESQGEFAAHYLDMGRETDADLDSKEKAGLFTREAIVNNPQPRFQAIKSILQKLGPEKTKFIYDFGCGHGWSPLFIAGNFPESSVTGYDIDPYAIAWCEKLKDRVIENEKQCFFTNTTTLVYPIHDVLICQEVLEHLLNWRQELLSAELKCKPGAAAIITVPFGPWEFGGPSWFGRRNHIREFQLSDVRHIFRDKPNIDILASTEQFHPITGEPCGFYLITYTVDHQLVNDFNYEEKLTLQAPRQSLSTNIIAGPGSESTLRWCLESVKMISDEIVIGDTGMTETALTIAREFGCKIISNTPNPLVYGFDEARNKVLEASRGDWILWIDTDERLADPQNVAKYLRSNQFHGYSVQQIHCGTHMVPQVDFPVRLFRRRGEVKFYGVVHEHPEEFPGNKGPGLISILNDIQILHIGYQSEAVRMARFARNRPLVDRDQIKYPDRLLGKFLLMRDLTIMNQMEFHSNGKQISDAMKERAQKVVDLYREHFIDQRTLVGIDPRPQYSMACEVLGVGFDAVIEIRTSREGFGEDTKGGHRFANEEDFRRELNRIAQGKLAQIEGEFW